MWVRHLAAISFSESLINACFKGLFTIKVPPLIEYARVAELVDARDLKSLARKSVRVRFSSRAPNNKGLQGW